MSELQPLWQPKPTQKNQKDLYEERKAQHAHIRARLLQIINPKPGLTREQLQEEYFLKHGTMPTIDNRLRELRELGWVQSIEEQKDGLLHWYPKPVEEQNNA